MGSRRCRADIAHGLSRYFAIHSEGSGPYRDCGGAVSVEGKCASMEPGVAPQRPFRQAKVAGRRIWLMGEGGWGAHHLAAAERHESCDGELDPRPAECGHASNRRDCCVRPGASRGDGHAQTDARGELWPGEEDERRLKTGFSPAPP